MTDAPFRYCPGCGAAGTGTWSKGVEFRCSGCGFRFYKSVAAACGVLVRSEGRYLFVVRAKDPAQGKLGLPGGFVDPGEGVEQALAREFSEETGGTLGPVAFLASFPNSYPFAGVVYQTCDLYFQAELVCAPADLRADPSEVSALVWLAPEAVQTDDLAFPSLRALWKTLRTPGLSR